MLSFSVDHYRLFRAHPRFKKRFCPRVPVSTSRYKRPNNTPHITNESETKEMAIPSVPVHEDRTKNLRCLSLLRNYCCSSLDCFALFVLFVLRQR